MECQLRSSSAIGRGTCFCVLQAQPAREARLLTSLQVRLAGVYVCFAPTFFKHVWTVVSTFMSAKIRKV